MKTTSKSSIYTGNNAYIFFLTLLFGYLFFLLTLNFDKGLDITDESFYLLWAQYPELVDASVTRFGFYTGLLYKAVNYNIQYFRIAGLLILVINAFIFSISIEKLWNSYNKQTPSNSTKIFSTIAIISTSLCYYCIWQPTPSYNWLTLNGVLLFAIGMLQASAYANNNKIFTGYYQSILIGVGGSLAFMGKPTTAAVLAAIYIFWVTITPLRNNWKTLSVYSFLSSIAFITLHIILFEKGFIDFYTQLERGFNLVGKLAGGHSFIALFSNIKAEFFELSKYFATYTLYLSASYFIFLLVKMTLTKLNKSLVLPLYLLPLAASIFLWVDFYNKEQWIGGDNIGTYIAYAGLRFSFILLISALLLSIKPSYLSLTTRYGKTEIKNLLIMYGLLFLLVFAYSFGSNLGIIRQMSFAFIFIATACIYSARWIDHNTSTGIVTKIVSLLLIFSTILILNSAYLNPNRMPGNISDQNILVTFIDSEHAIKLDAKTAKYANNLMTIANESNWSSGTSLIDMTGGSPGATVILNAKFIGSPWLIGAYKGSNEFVYTALSYGNINDIKSAWILDAPNGERRLDGKLLEKFNVYFPQNYIQVGQVLSGHRNEIQILYKPKYD